MSFFIIPKKKPNRCKQQTGGTKSKDGVRVETVRGTTSVVEKLGEAVSKIVEKRASAQA